MRIWSWFLCPIGKEGALLTQRSYDKNCRTEPQLRFQLSKCWKATTASPRNIPHSQGGSLPWISAEDLPQEFLQPNTGCWSTSLTALTLIPLSHISVSLHLVKSSLWGITPKSHKKQDVSNMNDQIKPALHRQHIKIWWEKQQALLLLAAFFKAILGDHQFCTPCPPTFSGKLLILNGNATFSNKRLLVQNLAVTVWKTSTAEPITPVRARDSCLCFLAEEIAYKT